MARLRRKQAKEMIEAYLAEHADATTQQIGKVLGVSKQRAHILLKMLGMATQKQGKNYNPKLLTKHEMKILHCIVGGMSNMQIAEALGVTVYTIKNQVSVIVAKPNANNRAHAVTLAMQRGGHLIERGKINIGLLKGSYSERER